jgi:hypothetical protein
MAPKEIGVGVFEKILGTLMRFASLRLSTALLIWRFFPNP